ncbi:HD domain-containing protein [bacterium]|nr:HD domain-containing protein [candidate division CSSED10-310 bacterium]
MVDKWLASLPLLTDSRGTRPTDFQQLLNESLNSAMQLSAKGDDISAWLGLKRLASVTETAHPGRLAANQYAAAAFLSACLFIHQETDALLEKMRSHFCEQEHPIAAKYWFVKGLSLNLRHHWLDAIPCLQLSYEHVEKCSPREIKKWFPCDRHDDLLANRQLNLSDCWINLGWQTEGKERSECIKSARKHLARAATYHLNPVSSFLYQLNTIETEILEGNLEEAREHIQYLNQKQTVTSPRAARLRPGLFYMHARLSLQEQNTSAMITHLSQALAESSRFPDPMQELMVVDFSLSLMESASIERKRMEPFFEAMVVMLEAKDWYTGRDHSRSVAEFSLKLWQQWQSGSQSPEFLEDLYWAGYLHDVGKLRLSRSLLNKIAPLSEEEWELLRLHPGYAQSILDRFGFKQIAIWVGEHHQDACGTGYPGKLAASPVGMCIAVADYLEASTSANRKYRRPKTFTEAIHELKTNFHDRYPEKLLKSAEIVGKQSIHHDISGIFKT